MRKLFILFAICLSLPTLLSSQDLDALITETQITKTEGDAMKIAWLIPLEFWQLSMDNETGMTDAAKEEMYSILSEYFIVAIVDGDMGPFGGMPYASEEDLQRDIELKLNGKELEGPLADRKIDSDMKVMLSTFKPVLKSMLGDLGENFHFFVYEDMDKKDNRILDPYEAGSLELMSNDEIYTWNLPLESLFPLKKCPTDKAEMNGAWKFCPYHGVELVEAKE